MKHRNVFSWYRKRFFCIGVALLLFTSYSLPNEAALFQEDESGESPAQSQVATLSEKIEATNNKLSQLALQIESLDAEIHSIEDEIARLKDSLLHIREEKEQLREYLYEFIRYQYESRMDFSLQATFFQSKSFADFLNRQNYISAFIESFWDKMKEYDDIDALIIKRTNELEDLKQEQEEKREELKQAKKRFEEQIASLSKELKDAERKADSENASSVELSEWLAETEEREWQMLERTESPLPEEDESWSENVISDGTNFWKSNMDYPYSDADLTLLAGIIQAEAGNQPYEGKIAVGSVVMNRVEDERFPNTIEGVIYSPNQFTPAGSGRLAVILAEGPSSECLRAAEDVLQGTRNVSNLYFKSAAYAASHGITGIQIADQVFH